MKIFFAPYEISYRSSKKLCDRITYFSLTWCLFWLERTHSSNTSYSWLVNNFTLEFQPDNRLRQGWTDHEQFVTFQPKRLGTKITL